MYDKKIIRELKRFGKVPGDFANEEKAKAWLEKQGDFDPDEDAAGKSGHGSDFDNSAINEVETKESRREKGREQYGSKLNSRDSITKFEKVCKMLFGTDDWEELTDSQINKLWLEFKNRYGEAEYKELKYELDRYYNG